MKRILFLLCGVLFYTGVCMADASYLYTPLVREGVVWDTSARVNKRATRAPQGRHHRLCGANYIVPPIANGGTRQHPQVAIIIPHEKTWRFVATMVFYR